MVVERDIDHLPKNAANYTALTPLSFLERAAMIYPNRKSLIHGSVQYTWLQTYRRCSQLASALTKRSITFGTTVAVIAPNVPAMYEAHFGIPMAGAVLNAVNVRLNADTIAFLLGHCSAAVVMVDQEFFPLAEEALKILEDKSEGKSNRPLIVVIADKNCDPAPLQYALDKGAVEYDNFLETGDPDFQWKPPQDEWQSIALGYTSGTTASPKGVVLHHRGAYLMALSNAVVWSMKEGAVYLWTLPMFHCNGWCFTWTLAAICGTNICLRQVTAKAVYSAIAHLGVTHFSAAPVVLNTIVNASKEETILPLPRLVHVSTAGASPPPPVLAAMTQRGFRVLHTYGLSETYGPSTLCTWKPEWDLLPTDVQARLNARQGVRYVSLEHLDVVNPTDMTPVPADGKTMGEIVFRGNVVMKGYLKNPKANEAAFAGGWYHSGDLAVKHPDGYIEIKDRSKDIIISGGENISSVEVENILYQHPAILEVSVVARPDEQWGESPCAFVTLKPAVKKTDAMMSRDVVSNNSKSAVIDWQLWHQNGTRCPAGTVPIRRSEVHDVLRAKSLYDFGKKKRHGLPIARRVDAPDVVSGNGHEHAIAYTGGSEEIYGAKATINVWEPSIEVVNEFSLSQIWVLSGSFDGSDLNSIEAGWQVSPELYGDSRPRLFTYWTSDSYQATGCYNLLCSGFVQTNSRIAIGAAISPVSSVEGSQYDVTILIWKDPKLGNWWMVFGDNTLVGYWPAELFTHLAERATMVEWGGEIVNSRANGEHTSTQMGSGHFGDDGFRKASYFRNLEIVDSDNSLSSAQDISILAENTNCYNIKNAYSTEWGTHFYYGGPGRNPQCN